MIGTVRDQEKFFIGTRQTVKELPHIRSRLYVVLHMLAHNFMHNWVRWADCVLMEQIKQNWFYCVVSICVSGSFSGWTGLEFSIEFDYQRDKVLQLKMFCLWLKTLHEVAFQQPEVFLKGRGKHAPSTHLYIPEQDFRMVIDVIAIEKFRDSRHQIHFWDGKQIGELNHLSRAPLRTSIWEFEKIWTRRWRKLTFPLSPST